MINKILGVVCLIAAGGLYTAERIAMVWSLVAQDAATHSTSSALEPLQGSNPFVVFFLIFGALLLIGSYGKEFISWLEHRPLSLD